MHLDLVGPLPLSHGKKYIFTIIVRFSPWIEAIPAKYSTAETVARAFVAVWVARFGVPLRITPVPPFPSSYPAVGCTHLKTTPYHRAANSSPPFAHTPTPTIGLIIRFVLLGLRSVVREDLKCSTAELVYGATLRSPEDFLSPVTHDRTPTVEFVDRLRQIMSLLRPVATRVSASHPTYYPAGLAQAKCVFVRCDTVRKPLQRPYDGSFEELERNATSFKVKVRNREERIDLVG
ncbi:uncharacterized protein LOC135375615 [Ornithodoros turicata]|uniref:uncharacterized protein LOC135375615 n=1 Tax=Ornithodoros turicata TaxID=34597 RepID=UPI00313A1927